MALERWQGQIAPAEAEATLALVSGSMEGSIFHWGGRGGGQSHTVPHCAMMWYTPKPYQTIPYRTRPYQTVPDRTWKERGVTIR